MVANLDNEKFILTKKLATQQMGINARDQVSLPSHEVEIIITFVG